MVRQTSELPAQRRCEVLLLDTNGYTAGLDTKIPVGRIVCDSTFDSYSLHGVNGEDWGQGENPVFSTQVLSRTVGGRFRYRISLLYRRSLFLTPNASENESRTTGSLFEHRMRIPYHRRPSPVPNAANGRKEKSIACSECHNCQKRGAQCKKRRPGCRREQENHSQKVCNTAPKLLNTSRKSRCRQNPLNAAPKLPNATRIFAANPGVLQCHPKSTSPALTPHFMAFEDTHSGRLFYQSEMPIVPYRSLSQGIHIREKYLTKL